MNISDVEVDLCLAVVNSPTIPKDDSYFADRSLLKQMDSLSLRSINGFRDVSVLLNLIPDLELFRQLTKVVKLWAKKRGLTGAGLGYPTGISWTVMAAAACQLHPELRLGDLVAAFFRIFNDWHWPKPVLLKPLEEFDSEIDSKPWNSKTTISDSYHKMPIITPAYPEHNSAFTVTKSNLKVIGLQFKEAIRLIDTECDWSELFKPMDMFASYKHFLLITASALSHDDIIDWNGLLESRIRVFVELVEQQSESNIAVIHPHVVNYYDRSSETTSHWVIGLSFRRTAHEALRLDLSGSISNFKDHVVNLALERKIYAPGMELAVRDVKRKDLKLFLRDEDNPSVKK